MKPITLDPGNLPSICLSISSSIHPSITYHLRCKPRILSSSSFLAPWDLMFYWYIISPWNQSLSKSNLPSICLFINSSIHPSIRHLPSLMQASYPVLQLLPGSLIPGVLLVHHLPMKPITLDPGNLPSICLSISSSIHPSITYHLRCKPRILSSSSFLAPWDLMFYWYIISPWNQSLSKSNLPSICLFINSSIHPSIRHLPSLMQASYPVL